ncbi:hypothetical protein [Rubellimicrobium aerolatum]|uniref:Uncharacterized protein n=1 Tax=Rubellimicrobium aerolatum TaxID=490979 RepID=A0ABW0SCF0_9RHOB|nr:hypothetical protein [Rubellimicrobium aerolatum]MBP1806288.1 hypothetical protein [Rubellimicrobium aerolatum]
MCNACGFPAAPGHWTEAGAVTPHDRLRARLRRAGMLRDLLRPYGLTVHDDGQVPGLQLSNLSGVTTILPDLQALWAEAERMAGRPVDPLDPRVLGDG